jgi:hypothetical protein
MKKDNVNVGKTTVGDILFALYDAPRRMMCGMEPFDSNFHPFKKEEKKEVKKEAPSTVSAATAKEIRKAKDEQYHKDLKMLVAYKALTDMQKQFYGSK